MFRSYLLIAFRVFHKQKLYTFINVGGLTIGLTTALLIFLWVQDERNMDQFHEERDTLYSVIRETKDNQKQLVYGNNTPGPLGPMLKQTIPEINETCRMTYPAKMAFAYNDHKGIEEGIYADASVLKMFTFPMVVGSSNHALDEPGNIVLSKRLASKYFKEKNPMGEPFTFTNGFISFDFKVTGVLEDPPSSSSLHFDFIIPFEKYLQINEWATGWGSSSFKTYVQLTPDAYVAGVDQKIEHLITEHHEIVTDNIFLQPFHRTYLFGDISPGRVPGGRITYVRLFSWIGAFILLIACINFMNLATARSVVRTKEVGVRKVVGANRKSLFTQFMTEAILISVTSTILAVLTTQWVLPAFNQLTGKQVSISFMEPRLLIGLLVLSVLTGLISGSYPALFLSAFKPVEVLKGKMTRNFGEFAMRKVLVVFQFTISITLVIATLVVFYQIHYIKNKNLGMDRENVIFLNASAKIISSRELFRTELLQQPGIKYVSYTSNRPSQVYNSTGDPFWEGMQDDERLGFKFSFTGYDFLKTLDIDPISGRDFSREVSQDTLNYILNETAVRMMNLEEPLGKTFNFWGRKGEIIGVVKDFHYSSLYEQIEPFVILLWPENCSYILVKTEAGNTTEALSSLKRIYTKFVPDYPLEYSFLDDDFERTYRNEILIGQLANYFTIIVIIISCLGLFGLASFTAERRTKEIGIRKVLGASVQQVVTIISKDFLILVGLAILLAIPVAWYLMDQWLSEFYYHIALRPWVFLLAGLAAIIIATITVSFQAIKAGLTNPVTALRSE